MDPTTLGPLPSDARAHAAERIAGDLALRFRHKAPAAAPVATSPPRWASRRLPGLVFWVTAPHTLGEHILVDRSAARGRLMAGLLMTIA